MEVSVPVEDVNNSSNESVSETLSVDCHIFQLCPDSTGFQCKWQIDNNEKKDRYEYFEMDEDLDLSIEVSSLWEVRFYPLARSAADAEMGLFVKYLPEHSDHEELVTLLRFQVLDAAGTVVFSSQSNHVFDINENTNYSFFLPVDEETCTQDEVIDFFNEHSQFTVLIQGAGWAPHLAGVVKVRQDLQNRLDEIKSLEAIYEAGSDITFRIKDGEEMGVTVDRLLSKCGLLRTFKEHHQTEVLAKPLSLCGFTDDELKPEILREFLHFVRTESVTQYFSDVVEELLRISVALQVDDLRILTENRLIQMVRVENAARYFILAFRENAFELQVHVAEFIWRNSSGVLRTDGWFQLEQEHGPIVALTRIILEKKFQ